MGGATGTAFEGDIRGHVLASVKRVGWVTPPGTTESEVAFQREPSAAGGGVYMRQAGNILGASGMLDRVTTPTQLQKARALRGGTPTFGTPVGWGLQTPGESPPNKAISYNKPGMDGELRGLKMSALRKRAIAAGVTQHRMDIADDSPNPREALVSAILEVPNSLLVQPASGGVGGVVFTPPHTRFNATRSPGAFSESGFGTPGSKPNSGWATPSTPMKWGTPNPNLGGGLEWRSPAIPASPDREGVASSYLARSFEALAPLNEARPMTGMLPSGAHPGHETAHDEIHKFGTLESPPATPLLFTGLNSTTGELRRAPSPVLMGEGSKGRASPLPPINEERRNSETQHTRNSGMKIGHGGLGKILEASIGGQRQVLPPVVHEPATGVSGGLITSAGVTVTLAEDIYEKELRDEEAAKVEKKKLGEVTAAKHIQRIARGKISRKASRARSRLAQQRQNHIASLLPLYEQLYELPQGSEVTPTQPVNLIITQIIIVNPIIFCRR